MLLVPNFTGDGASSPIRLRALSLGAGVQSTTMALMAAHGEIGPISDAPEIGLYRMPVSR
uniref:hypothetical protein n=1 Tax=Agrobacterium tumefaciens TaxID=358 RepID=UPI001FFC8C3F|nr:hypothetical protein [Agrobacterium tumefaciens]